MIALSGAVLLFLILGITVVFTKNKESKRNINSTNESSQCSVIIVGAGIAGSALAFSLARQGRKVTLIERDLSEPNRIVGELLQPGGLEHIKSLGLEHCFESIDSPTITGYAVFNGNEKVELTYPPNSKGVKPTGRSFHHGRFVQQLRKSAAEEPNVTIIQGTVNQLIEEQDTIVGVIYKDGSKQQELKAPLVVICDGIFSKFRKQFIKSKPVSNSSFVGFVVSDLQLPFPDKGHVFLADGTPTLCYPISSTEARFLVDIENPLPSSSNGDLAKYLLTEVASKLPSPVKEAVSAELRTGRIRSMPCSRLHPEYFDKQGIVFLGDAWNIRHPITGAGMSVALSDVVLLTELLKPLSLTSSEEIHQVIKKKFFTERIKRVAATNVLAESIYQVFAGREHMKAMQQAIFSYFKIGPKATTTPICLLACIETNPMLLMYHFFVVAIYGSFQIIIQSPLSFITAIRVLTTAASFFLPMLYREHIVSFKALKG